MSALLNYKREGQGKPLILLHGLFGDLNNLGVLARDLKQDFDVVSIDLRNHGQSFHRSQHNYPAMAQDVAELLKHLNIDNPIVVGHSMGGKVAMKLCDLPLTIDKLIVLDMAPVKYLQRRHDAVLAGLTEVANNPVPDRRSALALMAKHIELEGVRQFLAKSLDKQDGNMCWKFNLETLKQEYMNILDWQPIEQTDVATLFVKGGDSDYLLSEHQPQIQAQFNNAKAHIIANTGHWLHAEKPIEVLRSMRKFLGH
ncbi:alpha/beta fold hydrolase [Vibrio hippocampi]|nr:alpha/beta fold hydrolase [Vibrio hippocampi]